MVEVTDAELDQEARELLAHLNSVPFAHEYRMEGETYGQIVDVLRRLIDGRAALRARIEEDQAQIAALTTYRENLRDEVIELRARIAELEVEVEVANDPSPYCPICGSCGEDGCCSAQRCLYSDDKLMARIAELEADRAEWVEVERQRMGKV